MTKASMETEPQGTDPISQDVEPTAQPAAEPQGDATDWKAEARKWEKRAKENNDAASELAKLKEAQMSDLEKANKRADEAERELAEIKARAEIEQIKQEVAKESGVPADVLSGGTREEIEAHAERIKPLMVAPVSPVIKTDGTHPKTSSGDARSEFAAILADF